MSSNWFDFDEDITSEFFDKAKVEYIKKNFGLTSKKVESRNWSSNSEVNDILDLATSKLETREKSKLLDSLLKDRFLGRSTLGRSSRFSEEPIRVRNETSDFFSNVDERVSRIRSRFANEKTEPLSERRSDKKESRFDAKLNFPEKSPSCSSANSYGFTDVTNDPNRCRKDSVDSSWSKKSCQGNVTFPTSSASTISEACGGFSDKTIGRSISRDSDDSVCTEKSVNCSTVSEKLPDGTDKTQVENNESWLRKSTSGSKIAEKKVNDTMLTEKNEDNMCEKSTTKMSYLEKSATGSSLQEEMTSQRMTSSGKGGMKTVEQKTSSETYKKSSRSTPNKSSFYDDLDSCSFDHFAPPSFSKEDREKASSVHRREFFRPNRAARVSEKISKLIDEAVHQDDLFKIPSDLQTDIDKMTDDFFNSKSFGQDRSRTGRKRLAGLFSGAGKGDSYLTCSQLTELKAENESLQQENLKLQSIIQDVTAVNKRWQKYNNERRLYVQKLLSTIQDLQEQINLISEKSAFQSKPQEEAGGRHDEIERLKKEHEEHITVLELQIKSHKDDWDAERKEKRKALQEKEELENKVQELTRDVKFLKNVLQEERQRKSKICTECKCKHEESELFQRLDFRPPAAPLKVSNPSNSNFLAAVHVPYDTTETSSEECYCTKEDIRQDGGLPNQEHGPYFAGGPRSELNETFSNERFSRTSKSKKTMSGDTIVVEDESGIRLSITEQFPSKDGNLKSILKKNDKKNKSSSKSSESKEDKESKASRNRRPSADKPNITCEEFTSADSAKYGLSIGFQESGLAQVTSFSPDSITACNSAQYLSAATTQLLKVGTPDSRSKSEPNTRSNSSENLKPLRESSSWNSESFGVDTNTRENVVCPGCDAVFPPSMHLQFLDHFEICQTANNHF